MGRLILKVAEVVAPTVLELIEIDVMFSVAGTVHVTVKPVETWSIMA